MSDDKTTEIQPLTLRMPSLEYLMECSRQSLYDLELFSLSRAAQCLKAAKHEWEEAAALKETAGVARWLIENRENLLAQARRTVAGQKVAVFPETSIVIGRPTKRGDE